MSLKNCIIVVLASLAFAAAGFAAPAKRVKKEVFPSGPLIERKVKFWESIFMKYNSDQLVIHDLQQPDLVVGVIAYDRKSGQKIANLPKAYSKALQDFASKGSKARSLSSLHKKIWNVYRADGSAKSRLISGRAQLRSQLGLSDIFHSAALRAQKYLPRMEKIFAQHDLPTEITRLPFVESMFQIEARSKVGAAGLWQIMPAAAKPHIRVDERDSPMKATLAAAKIMKANYKKLGNWPLAITAYNHGVNGVARGVNKIGSENLADLILSYKSKSFGFASRNFYAEFLAAQRSYDKWQIANTSIKKPKSKQLALTE